MRTALTELLGIEAPIVLAPMGGAVTPELAAAVSNAGGLGTHAVELQHARTRSKALSARSLH